MSTKELLEAYYNGLAQKKGWDSVLSEDFKFTGGDMTKTDPLAGKQAYNEVCDQKIFASVSRTPGERDDCGR